ncbi:MAG: tRNA uridine-5-carboxymethylaminomethyl(34) synthesis GTPase MnmE, partial [Calditrichaeota bacterium]
MKYIDSEETIVALSTPAGRGAIAVIRISGVDSLSIINQLSKRQLKAGDHRMAVRSEIRSRDGSRLLDDCVLTYFRSPNSYTGEDVVEISCHCNHIIIEQIIREVL